MRSGFESLDSAGNGAVFHRDSTNLSDAKNFVQKKPTCFVVGNGARIVGHETRT